MKIKFYTILMIGLMAFTNASCSDAEKDAKTESTGETISTEEETTEVATTEVASATEPSKASAEGTVKVKMKTTLGDVTILLYDATPLHRDNFVKLVNEKFYEGLLFHRVIKDFMVQGGDPDSKDAAPGVQLGAGGPGYTIPAEIMPGLYHKKGALCAARQGQGNPEKRSSGSQFYIVTGKVTPKGQMETMAAQQVKQQEDQLIGAYLQNPANTEATKKYTELQQLYQTGTPENQKKAEEGFNKLMEEIRPLALKDFKPTGYTAEQMEVYSTIGGTPFLDNNYTVYGEVIEGLDIVDKMGAVSTAPGDRPVEDLKIISMEIIK